MWKGEDYLNTLLVDAYFFKREKKTSVFKPIPVVQTTRHYHLCSGTVILKSSHDFFLMYLFIVLNMLLVSVNGRAGHCSLSVLVLKH